ncbi:hypothetical protein D1872_284320 [compost metagenome]
MLRRETYKLGREEKIADLLFEKIVDTVKECTAVLCGERDLFGGDIEYETILFQGTLFGEGEYKYRIRTLIDYLECSTCNGLKSLYEQMCRFPCNAVVSIDGNGRIWRKVKQPCMQPEGQQKQYRKQRSQWHGGSFLCRIGIL